MRRLVVMSCLACCAMTVCMGSAEAQNLPISFTVDSSFGLGYLFGWQMFHYIVGPEYGHIAWDPRPTPSLDPYGIYRTEFSPRVAVLYGSCEWSPLPFASGRLAGSLSVAEANTPFTHSMLATFDPTTFPYPNSNLWDVVPDFTSWEAAGLYHLWSGYGYRFSVVGGYRQESWTFLGTPSDSTDVSLSLHDRFTSHIPFLALQTAMFYPWWKARFEVLGSPFMSKKVTATVRNGGTLVDFKGWADRGGLIEFSMEGTCALTSVLRLGLYGRYSYQELYGWVTKRIGGQSGEYKLGFNENTGVVGTNLTLLF